MLKQDKKGFTIIEVLIVLAIGGIIMLIVFLAVPSLQRNNRNTQRKNDVSVILGGITEYASNNKGALPTSAAEVVANANTGYFSGAGTSAGQIGLTTGATAALDVSSAANIAANDRVLVVKGAKCGTNGAAIAGTARQFVALYILETSAGATATCQEG